VARRPLARHIASYTHGCPIVGMQVGANRALRWSPVSKRLARQKPPCCGFCGQPMELKTVAYQAAAADDWDPNLERTRAILEALAAERELN
jgi:hypothetical protein